MYAASRCEKEAIQQADGGALGFDARVGFGKTSTCDGVGENGYAWLERRDVKRVVCRSVKRDLYEYIFRWLRNYTND